MEPITDIDRLSILKRGLCVPLLTPMTDGGRPSKKSLHALLSYVSQDGRGSRIFFLNGTTGEFNLLDNPARQKLISWAMAWKKKMAGPPAFWCGVAGNTPEETLDNIHFVMNEDIDAAVIAPLYFLGHSELLSFFRRDLPAAMEKHKKHLPVFLYDNKNILSPVLANRVPPPLSRRELGSYFFRTILQSPATAMKEFFSLLQALTNPDKNKTLIRQIRGYLLTREVKFLSRLDYVVGIKVTAPPRILGNYIRASRNFQSRGTFGIYVGNAPLIFNLFRERRGLARIVDGWQKFILRATWPHGVVAGPANILPREWRAAWESSLHGDEERMDVFQALFQRYKEICTFGAGRKSIACAKMALHIEGVLESPASLLGDKSLTLQEMRTFEKRYGEFQRYRKDHVPEAFISVARQDPLIP